MGFYSTPRLPRALLHKITVTEPAFERDPANGGQSRKVAKEACTFQGIVMPLGNQDWRRLPEGSYTLHTCKVYTDDKVDLKPGQTITDQGRDYVVKTLLEHNSIHPMLRCLVEAVGL